MKKTFLVLVLTLSFVAQGFGQAATKANSPAMRAANDITAAQLRDYLYFVASDEMEGRDTPSRGLDLTAKFLAMQIARWGIKPAGDNNTYFQKIELSRTQTDATGSQLEIDGQRLTYGTDYFASAANANVAATPIVFGGEGWYIKSKNIDPYKDMDVKGKTVVIYSENFPRGFNSYQELAATGQYGVDWIDPTGYARRKGAAALIIVATPTTQNNWAQVRQARESGNLAVEKLRDANRPAPMPVIYLSRNAAEALFRGESNDMAKISDAANSVQPFTFNSNKRININVASKSQPLYTQNVVGMIEGSDPTLKAEIVAVGAHYDHVGVNSNASGEDKIWNGADDDGSGTVAVLAIAEAIAKSPRKPKRSILFVWHAGEEKGLWGSEYFVKYPTVPINNIVTQFNIDMIGRSKKAGDTDRRNAELSGPNEIYVIGSKMMSTQLGSTSEAINNSYLKLNFNYKYDDPKDPNRFFFRSDHFNYATKGIPIIFYFDGVHEDYHQPGDHPDKIDYEKMEKVSRTILATMWEIADAKTRPAVDKQLPPELTR